MYQASSLSCLNDQKIMTAIQKALKIKLHVYLHQYHNNNPWTDLLSHSQPVEPGHVS